MEKKKTINNNRFDLPTVSFFGAELCDLIGLYALISRRHLCKNYKTGLNWNNALPINNRKYNEELKRSKNYKIKTFKDLGF